MANRRKLKILVSILNWNNSKATNLCLSSIASIPKNEQPDIMLIDNGSEKEKLNLDKSILNNLLELDVVFNKKNLGFAGGHNISILKALNNSYDVVFLLNNDAEIIDKNIFDLLGLELTNSDAAGIAPKILSNQSKNDVWFGGGKYSKIFGHTEHIDLNINSTQPVDFLTGCCLGINLKLLGKKALLSEDYFLYWEDSDWSVKRINDGLKLLYDPRVKISHNVSSSLGRNSSTYAYYNIRNSFLFMYRCVHWYFWPTTLLRNHYVLLKYMLLTIINKNEGGARFILIVKAWWNGICNKSGEIA